MLRQAFVVLGVTVLAVGSVWSADTNKTPWKISGELEEACSCDAACPCWWGSKPTKPTCGGGETLFIEKGTYGNVSLDGLAVAYIGQSPAGQSMMEAFGNWNFANLYIDEKANPEQRKALEEIALAIGGPAAPKDKMKVKYVSITRKVSDKEHDISLGSFVNYAGHLIDGGLGGPTKITNPIGADPVRKEFSQGRTSKYVFNDAGQKWNFSGSNYMWNKFSVTSEDYEKHMAGLSQKMEEMKKKKM
jgi:hypothetical protein